MYIVLVTESTALSPVSLTMTSTSLGKEPRQEKICLWIKHSPGSVAIETSQIFKVSDMYLDKRHYTIYQSCLIAFLFDTCFLFLCVFFCLGRGSQQFFSHVGTFSWVEPVLSNEDESVCSRTQQRACGEILTSNLAIKSGTLPTELTVLPFDKCMKQVFSQNISNKVDTIKCGSYLNIST